MFSNSVKPKGQNKTTEDIPPPILTPACDISRPGNKAYHSVLDIQRVRVPQDKQ